MICATKNATKIRRLRHLNAALMGIIAAMSMAMIAGCSDKGDQKSWEDFQETSAEHPLHVSGTEDGDFDVYKVTILDRSYTEIDGSELLCYMVDLETSNGTKNTWFIGHWETNGGYEAVISNIVVFSGFDGQCGGLF